MLKAIVILIVVFAGVASISKVVYDGTKDVALSLVRYNVIDLSEAGSLMGWVGLILAVLAVVIMVRILGRVS